MSFEAHKTRLRADIAALQAGTHFAQEHFDLHPDLQSLCMEARGIVDAATSPEELRQQLRALGEKYPLPRYNWY